MTTSDSPVVSALAFIAAHPVLATVWLVVIGLMLMAAHSEYLDRKYGGRR